MFASGKLGLKRECPRGRPTLDGAPSSYPIDLHDPDKTVFSGCSKVLLGMNTVACGETN